MRGNVRALSRLSPAWTAFLLTASLIGATASTARAEAPGDGDETALAIPRVKPHGMGVALPQPLAPSDGTRVRHILALQRRGHVDEAERETAQVEKPLLLGHILADRYLGHRALATAEHLNDWLSHYSDEPDAPAIYILLLRKLPKGAAAPPAPELAGLAETATGDPEPEDIDPRDPAFARDPAIEQAVVTRAQANEVRSALGLISRNRGVGTVYAALLRAEIAQVQFTANRDADAVALAGPLAVTAPAEQRVGLAGYVAGLASWRLGRRDLALAYFEAAAQAGHSSSAVRAAAAFWAARAHLQLHDPRGYLPWMKRAADESRTFYGLLARRTLGLGSGFSWDRETLGEADVEAVAATPQGERAFALLEVGETRSAEAELRLMWPAAERDPALLHAVLLVADAAGFSALAAQLASLDQDGDGAQSDLLRFPLPRLRPRGGFRVDPPLVYALARVESNFDSQAVSAAGARGLMQLLPVAVSAVGVVLADADQLGEPAFNLALGQRYLCYLAEQEGVGSNLIRLLASYNAGPGNLLHWLGDMRDGGDPLLFIEAIPNPETRSFVEHVLAYSWIYAARLHLSAPSLDELAAGAFPRFTPLAKPAGVPRSRPKA